MVICDKIEETLPSSIKKARNESKKSDHYQYKLGATVVKNGKIISSGFNHLRKTSPQIKIIGGSDVKTVHAEMACIFKLKNKELLKGATVVVYREKKDGTLACARPCPICLNFLSFYGIKKVIYTTNEGIYSEYLNGGRKGEVEVLNVDFS